jgi:MFS transporter, NNP family, nitrate/nitrite transporter
VDEPHTGSVTGIVGAGGNVGAVCFSLAFRFMADAKNSLMIMGGVALVSALLSVFIQIEGHESILFSPFNVPNDSTASDEEAPSSNSKVEQL